MCRPAVGTQANPYNPTNFMGSRFTRFIQTQLPTNLVPIVERRVVRHGYVSYSDAESVKSISCLNRTRYTPVPQSALFSPIFSLAGEKIGPPEADTRYRFPLDLSRIAYRPGGTNDVHCTRLHSGRHAGRPLREIRFFTLFSNIPVEDGLCAVPDKPPMCIAPPIRKGGRPWQNQKIPPPPGC